MSANVEAVERYMRHDGLCGIVGGYGYCTCGMDAAKAEVLAALSRPSPAPSERSEAYRRGLADAANVAREQTRANVQARRDRADDTLAFEFQGLGDVIETAILALANGDAA